jgi:hypothetical protein
MGGLVALGGHVSFIHGPECGGRLANRRITAGSLSWFSGMVCRTLLESSSMPAAPRGPCGVSLNTFWRQFSSASRRSWSGAVRASATCSGVFPVTPSGRCSHPAAPHQHPSRIPRSLPTYDTEYSPMAP